jgi:ubiquinone/menaquinone biosynthesis C-methylase UbiE
MAWSSGHKDDWDYFASEAGDPAWNYESVLNIYRRKTRKIETVKKLAYVFGHSQREIQRLISQAAIVRRVTESLLWNVKVGPGMQVLDLGCGAGDVSMLAAEFVGPTGLVVEIDRSREVLTLAAEEAHAAGLREVSFEQACLRAHREFRKVFTNFYTISNCVNPHR